MLETLCGAAYAKACGSLALMAAADSPKDMPRAAGMYDRGCALLDEYSCFYGGKLFYFGAEGVEKDWPRARNMLTSACGATNSLIADACAMVAKMYIDGEGGQASNEIAVLMLKRGCDMRNATSCKALKLPVPQ
jgi:TPR repeat protein